MKIVIDIDEYYYELIKHYVKVDHNDFKPHVIIANGTPLPKGHGRLKDIDKVERLLDLDKPDNILAKGLKTIIESVPTIIEADKGETE